MRKSMQNLLNSHINGAIFGQVESRKHEEVFD
jgi:hypothetical protein